MHRRMDYNAEKHTRMGILRMSFGCPARGENDAFQSDFTVEAELSQ